MRFIAFGVMVVLVVGGADDARSSSSRSSRRRVPGARRAEPDRPPRDPEHARRRLRPAGAAARPERADLDGQDPARRPALLRSATPSSRASPGCSSMTPTDINTPDRREPRLAVRPRPDRARRPRGHGAAHRRGASQPPRRRGRRRIAARLPLRPAPLAGPRLHRRRSTPTSSPTSRRRGTCRTTSIGKTGVEAQYETELRGVYGEQTSSATQPAGRSRSSRRRATAEPGDSLQLTIDTQGAALRAEGARVGHRGGRRQARRLHRHEPADRRDPRDGEPADLRRQPVRPGHHDKDFQALLKDPNTAAPEPRDHRAVPAGLHVQARHGHRRARGRQAHSSSTELLTKPYVQIGPDKYWDWNHRGWGPLTIIEGFGHSSDTFFYQVSQMLGIDRLAYWANQFGFGAPTGIDLPGEVPGLVPTNQWKQDTFGQEIFPGETLPGRDRTGLRRRHAAPGAQRLRGARERRQAVPAAGRPAGHRAGRARSSGRSSRSSSASSGVVRRPPDDAAGGPERRRRSGTRTTSWTCRSWSPGRPARPSSASGTRRAGSRSTPGSWASCPKSGGNVDEAGLPARGRRLRLRREHGRATPPPRSSSTTCSYTSASRRTTGSRRSSSAATSTGTDAAT